MKSARLTPGELIAATIQRLGVNLEGASFELGLPEDDLRMVIEGRSRIRPELAEKLGAWDGSSAKFWLRVQATFDRFTAVGRAVSLIKESNNPSERNEQIAVLVANSDLVDSWRRELLPALASLADVLEPQEAAQFSKLLENVSGHLESDLKTTLLNMIDVGPASKKAPPDEAAFRLDFKRALRECIVRLEAFDE